MQNINLMYNTRQNDNPKIIQLIAQADIILFLGFHYAPENLKVLGVAEYSKHDVQIYGTARGIPLKQINKIKENLQGDSGSRHVALFPDLTCKELLERYL